MGKFITQRDLGILKYIEDIQLVAKASVDGAIFSFRENPFFSNTELKRVVGWEETSQGAFPVDEGTEILWKPNRAPLVGEESRKIGKVHSSIA